MAVTKYTRNYDFESFQAGAPSAPLPAAQIESELDEIKTVTDATIDELAKIQRDDGALANSSVHTDAFSPSALALMGGSWTPKGAWVTATAYVVGDVVSESTLGYVCAAAHTSGTFATDLAAGKWVPIGGDASGDAAAAATSATNAAASAAAAAASAAAAATSETNAAADAVSTAADAVSTAADAASTAADAISTAADAVSTAADAATAAAAATRVIDLAIYSDVSSVIAKVAARTYVVRQAITLKAGALGVKAFVVTASSSGGPVTVDINVNGATILSTKLTIDDTETDSDTAATPPVISNTALAAGDVITIDVDAAGTGAKGLVVSLIGDPT